MFPAPTTIASSVPASWTAPHLLGDRGDRLRVDPVLAVAEQRLARELEQDAVERRWRLRRGLLGGLLGADRHPATEILANRATDAPASSSAWPDRLRRLVDPRLVGEDAAGSRREEALGEHAVDDLLTRGLGLRLHLVRVHEDLTLGVDDVGRHVVARRPLGRGERDVHRELARELRRAALELDEDADLVRGRVRVARRRHGRPATSNRTASTMTMFSPSFPTSSRRSSSKRSTAPSPSAWTARSTLSPNAWNSSFFETGSVSQPIPTIEPAPSVDDVADEALGRLAARALARGRHAALAEQRAGGLEVAVRLLERALAVHHPRAVRSRSSLTRDALIVVLIRSHRSLRRPRRPARPRRGASLGRGLLGGRLRRLALPARAPRAGARARPGVTFDLPAAMPSATTRVTRLHERIASSLPGITKSASSGSAFVSTSPMTGRRAGAPRAPRAAPSSGR